MSRSKILFVDFDGVLNNAAMWFYSPSFGMDNQADYLSKTLTPKLNPIIEATDCYIVISSSWRMQYSLDEIKQFLTINGFKYSNKIIGITPKDRYGKREFEISEWLISYKNFSNYAILDDVAFNIETVHPNKFVKVNSDYGLTDENVIKIIEILNLNQANYN